MAPMSKKQLSKLGLAALAVISIAERRRKQRSTSVGRLWARPHISLSLGAVSNSDVGGHGFPLFSVSCSFDDLDFTDFQQLAEAFHEVQPWSSSASLALNFPHIMARNSTGAFAKLLLVLREREPSQFRNFLRMPVTTFDWHACCAAEHTIWMSKRRGLGQLATSQSAPSHAGCRTNLPFLCGLFGLA